jgi:hypothetical protein
MKKTSPRTSAAAVQLGRRRFRLKSDCGCRSSMLMGPCFVTSANRLTQRSWRSVSTDETFSERVSSVVGCNNKLVEHREEYVGDPPALRERVDDSLSDHIGVSAVRVTVGLVVLAATGVDLLLKHVASKAAAHRQFWLPRERSHLPRGTRVGRRFVKMVVVANVGKCVGAGTCSCAQIGAHLPCRTSSISCQCTSVGICAVHHRLPDQLQHFSAYRCTRCRTEPSSASSVALELSLNSLPQQQQAVCLHVQVCDKR